MSAELTKAESIAIAQADWATRNAVVERIITARERVAKAEATREAAADLMMARLANPHSIDRDDVCEWLHVRANHIEATS